MLRLLIDLMLPVLHLPTHWVIPSLHLISPGMARIIILVLVMLLQATLAGRQAAIRIFSIVNLERASQPWNPRILFQDVHDLIILASLISHLLLNHCLATDRGLGQHCVAGMSLSAMVSARFLQGCS